MLFCTAHSAAPYFLRFSFCPRWQSARSSGLRPDDRIVSAHRLRMNRDVYPVVMRPDFARTTRFPEHRLAWLVAIAADAIQIVGLPLFVEGLLSPVDTLLDVVVA